LSEGLITFFAVALECSDGTVGPYNGKALDKIHLSLGITVDAFNRFNEILIQVVAKAGVTKADQDTILALLQSTKTVIVSPGPVAPAPVPVAPFAPVPVGSGGSRTCPIGFQVGLNPRSCGIAAVEAGRLGNYRRPSKFYACQSRPDCAACLPYFTDTSKINC